jgi:hypothetical protein
MPNGFADIIDQLEKQKVAIDRALAALREVGDDAVRASTAKRPAKKAARVARTLSPEARERIAEAQRARWAATKKATKKAAKKAR